MPNRHSGDGAREAREAHNLDISGLDSRPRNQTPLYVGMDFGTGPAFSGTLDLSTGAVQPDPRRQSVPDPFAEELEASRKNRQSA